MPMPGALMTKKSHIPDRESCPFLPPALQVLKPGDSKLRRGKEDYFLSTLTCAQSLWLQGKPAQALLQLNHALSLPADMTTEWPLPYQAKVWIFTRRHELGFLGNPVRHYQHLASRVRDPNKGLRSWRAWACFHLAESVMPADRFPRDFRQLEKEQLVIPEWSDVLRQISAIGASHEAALLKSLLSTD